MTETARTADALLDAAEVAFAEHGVDGASLRSIMRDAGANAAAVHYHYGSREQLAAAVLDRVLAPLQARRLELLEAAVAEHTDGAPPITALMDALVRPDFEMAVAARERSPTASRIIGAVYARPSAFVKSLVEASFAPVAARFLPHLTAALPELDPPEIAWRVRWAVFGVLGALFSDEDTAINCDNMEAELGRMLAVTTGALSAPSTGDPNGVTNSGRNVK